MSKILIIGAYGGTARLVTARLLAETSHEVVLFLRNAQRLDQYKTNPRVTVIDGDVLDTAALVSAMAGVDLVYSNVGGANLAEQTTHILAAMQQADQHRLLFISALGAYHEVPGKFGEWNEQAIQAFLPGFRASAKLLAAAPVDVTEIRPAWLTDQPEVAYELTAKGTPFKGTEVFRASVADLVMTLIEAPTTHLNESLGIDKPGTDGDKPAWL